MGNSKQVFVSPIIMDTEANKVDAILLAANSIHRRFGASDDLTLVQIGKCVSAVLKKAKKAEAIEVENRAMNHIFESIKDLFKQLNPDTLAQDIMKMAKDLLNCDRSTLFLVDHSTDDDEKGLPVKNVNKDQLGVNEDAVEIPSG